MKFLLQTVGGRVRHDFVFEMEHAIDYQKWRGNEAEAAYCSLEDVLDGCKPIDADSIREYVPVGTIEFVYAFIDKFIKEGGSKEMLPLNIPSDLMDERFTGRKVANIVIDGKEAREKVYKMFSKDPHLFIKSNERIKDKVNGLLPLDVILSEEAIPNGGYQVSETVDIVSEYRCFIYNGTLVGIHYYSGAVDFFPNPNAIHRMIEAYQKGYCPVPRAYTLDVAVLANRRTVAIECHEFYSCGLYGFSDYNVLPYMFYRVFSDIKRRLVCPSS